MDDALSFFPESYEASRRRFREHVAMVQRQWPGARLESHPLADAEDLTIDWLTAEPQREHDRLLAFTTAEHGIEGYVGSAVLELFFRDVLHHVNPQTTGLLLVHAINPWGMQHRRGTNRHNVDLNRNFVGPDERLDSTVNPDYMRLRQVLSPQRPVGSWRSANTAFLAGLLLKLATMGAARVREASLLGQHVDPRGVYFGGQAIQEETQVLMQLLRSHISQYRQSVLLDMHTGYGPREQMTLVCSCLEPQECGEMAQRFGYPRVVKSQAGDFYRIHGDMIDWLYTLAANELPERRLFAASFEFGTLGASSAAVVRSLRAIVLENQMYWHGAPAAARAAIEREHEELYCPRDGGWRSKVLADAHQAMMGILTAEGLLAMGDRERGQ